jgi:hypothetical protein
MAKKHCWITGKMVVFAAGSWKCKGSSMNTELIFAF